MSGKPRHRPAHKVVLSRLGVRVEELRSRCHNSGILRLRILEAIGELCDLLREMTIPKKERESVLSELQQIASTWDEKTDGYNLVDAVRRDILARG